MNEAAAQAAAARNKKTAMGGEQASLKGELSAFHDLQERLEPLTAEQVSDLGEPATWHIWVEPHVPKYRGTLAVAPQVDDAERILARCGRIVAMGPFAYQSKTTSGLDLAALPRVPAVGDYVMFAMYAGEEIRLRSGHVLRCITDTEIIGVVKNPDAIKGYL